MSLSHSDVVKYVCYSQLEVCHLLLLPQLQIFLLYNLGVFLLYNLGVLILLYNLGQLY